MPKSASKKVGCKLGNKRSYTNYIILKDDAIELKSQPNSVQSASYKEVLSDCDMMDQTYLTKGVLLSAEDEVRKYIRRRTLKNLLMKVQTEATRTRKRTKRVAKQMSKRA